MKTLTEKEYTEFLRLKKLETKRKVRESLNDTYNLEDDIDFPIRNSVAILALAGCSPMFSCCGFDYAGQPFHKAHQYGEPYIMMRSDEPTKTALGSVFSRLPNDWVLTPRNGVIFLEMKSVNNPHWADDQKIHFPEMMVIGINQLEVCLMKYLSPLFQEEVILEDTNKGHTKSLKYWQYPPKNPWVITIDSLTV